MPLMKCIECGKTHTDTIENCPRCGFIIKKHTSLQGVKNEKIDVEDIMQDIVKTKQQSGAQGFFSTGHPLTNVFKVFGMGITTYIIEMFFYKYMFGFLVIGIFVLLTLPYFYHKKEDHRVYKTVSYLIWIITLLNAVHVFFTQHVLDQEETVLLNEKIFSLFSIFF